jgi:O-antigen/teichoic acid export membrane protein
VRVLQSYTEPEISTHQAISEQCGDECERGATLVSARHTLASGTLLYGLGEVLNRALPFLLLPLLTRYLSPADFGVTGMLTALGALLAPVFSLGLGAALAPVYFDARTDAHRGALLGSACAVLVASSTVMTGLVGLTATSISQVSVGSTSYGGLVVLTALGAASTSLTVPFRQYLQFERRPATYVTLSAVSTVLAVLFTLTLVVWIRRGVSGFIEATLLGQIATCLIFGGFVIRLVPLRFSHHCASQLLRLGLPLVPAFGSLFLLQHGTKYVLQQFHGVHEVGIFTVGLNIGLVMSVLVTAFQGAWVPFFMAFSGKPEQARIELGRIATYYVFCFGSLSLALFATAKPLVMLMTQPAFHEAWRVIGISGMTQVLAGLFIVLLPGMYFAKEVWFQGVLQLCAALASLAFGVALIPRFGGVGAAISMLLGYVILDLLLLWLNRVRGYVDVKYEWTRLGAFTAAYLIIAAVFLRDRNWSLAGEITTGMACVAGTALLVWTQLTQAERSTLRGWFRAPLPNTRVGQAP